VARGRPLVGDPSSFDPATLEALGREKGVGGGANLEKALWALELTAQLAEAGLAFVLKGGTAVQLTTEPAWPRFSIDVDICTDASVERLEAALGSIARRSDGGFAFEPRASRSMAGGPFVSYRVRTPPVGGPSRTILLDAYLSVPPYQTRRTPVRSFFYDSGASVDTPTAGDLLGDKLTTIASGTVGREVRDSRQGLDYAKHAFDIHRLVRSGPLPGRTIEAFATVVDEQCRIRGRTHSVPEVVDDVLATCQAIATIALPPDWRPDRAPALPRPLDELRRVFRRGVRDVRPLLMGGVVFGTDELVTAAGEAAMLAISMRSEPAMRDAIGTIAGDELGDRPLDESLGALSEGARGSAWFMDPDLGIYSRRSLATWAEVLRRAPRAPRPS
jgi:hypothetical protein